jgi:hypothetical protein
MSKIDENAFLQAVNVWQAYSTNDRAHGFQECLRKTIESYEAAKVGQGDEIPAIDMVRKVLGRICSLDGIDDLNTIHHINESGIRTDAYNALKAVNEPQTSREDELVGANDGIFHRKLMIDDGRVYWLYPDGSHRCLNKADVYVINKLRIAEEFKPTQTQDESNAANRRG